MKSLREKVLNIWKDDSAQGATEYILLLVVVVAIAILFKDKITAVIRGKVESLGNNIDSFNP